MSQKGLGGEGGILPPVLHGTASSASPYLAVLLLARGGEELVREEEEKAVPAQNTNGEQKKKNQEHSGRTGEARKGVPWFPQLPTATPLEFLYKARTIFSYH